MFQIVQVNPQTIEANLGIAIDMPAVAYVGIDDGKVIGSGGLAWGGGRCWLWLSMLSSDRSYALPIIRKVNVLLRKAKQFGDTEVFTPRDSQFETSEKLLKLSGFRMYAIENGIEVWACQV
jgi:hypothetical protein